MNFNAATVARTSVFCAVIMLFGQACIAKIDQQIILFEVKPKSCLIKDPKKTCLKEVVFVWQIPDDIPVCIQTKSKRVLFCQDGESKEEVKIEYKVTSSIQFELIHSVTKEVLAMTQLMVVKESKEKSAPHYRHPWSIF